MSYDWEIIEDPYMEKPWIFSYLDKTIRVKSFYAFAFHIEKNFDNALLLGVNWAKMKINQQVDRDCDNTIRLMDADIIRRSYSGLVFKPQTHNHLFISNHSLTTAIDINPWMQNK